MKIYGTCGQCKKEFSYQTLNTTRVEFAMRDAEEKTFNCKNCGKYETFQVDQLYAKPSRFAELIAILILMIGTPLIIYLLLNIEVSSTVSISYTSGFFILVPTTVYGIIKKQDGVRVKTWNQKKLKGRIGHFTS